MRTGRRVAIDVGSVRIGVAASDFHSILASGLTTIKRSLDSEKTINDLLDAITEIEPIEIYVGLPVSLNGNHTASTADALSLARQLAEKVQVELRMIDERMTTVSASNQLKSSNRSSKSGRSVIDQIAATIILEQAISQEKASSLAPGYPIGDFDE